MARLCARDRLLGPAELAARAGLDLDEDDGLTVLGDEVDLTLPRPPVVSFDTETEAFEVAPRQAFPSSGHLGAVHVTRSTSRCQAMRQRFSRRGGRGGRRRWER